MELSQDTYNAVAVGAAGVAVLSVLWNLIQARKLKRFRTSRRRRTSEQQPAGGGEVIADLEALTKGVASLREDLSYAIQRVGLVRFDAFDDLGGKLSFAAAMLDADGSGIVLSSINGRAETRIYAKPIEAGQSRHNLSAEEVEAIRRALTGAGA